jgi:hypothetical protein
MRAKRNPRKEDRAAKHQYISIVPSEKLQLLQSPAHRN